MVNSLFDPEEVESERTVIISERQQRKRAAFSRWRRAAGGCISRAHPYHHEVIGDLADLQSMQREDLFRHFRAYYVPNNAVLAIAGRFGNPGHVGPRARELFEPIPGGLDPQRLVRPELAPIRGAPRHG